MAEKTKPQRPSEEQVRQKLRETAAFVAAPEKQPPADVFTAGIEAAMANAHLHGKANHASHAQERKDARIELSRQRAETRAAAPPRSGQRPTVAQWTAHVRERLSRMTEEQRNELLWNSAWYDGLSERAATIVDGLLLEFGEEETRAEEMAAYSRSDLTAESEATARLNAELDEEYAFGDEYLPGTPEYELEAEMEEVEAGYGGEAA